METDKTTQDRRKYNIPETLITRQGIQSATKIQQNAFNRYVRLGIIQRALKPKNCSYHWKLYKTISIDRIMAYKKTRGTGFAKRENAALSKEDSSLVLQLERIISRLPTDKIPVATDYELGIQKYKKMEKRKKDQKNKLYLRRLSMRTHTKKDLLRLLNRPCPNHFQIDLTLILEALRYGWGFDHFRENLILDAAWDTFKALELHERKTLHDNLVKLDHTYKTKLFEAQLKRPYRAQVKAINDWKKATEKEYIAQADSKIANALMQAILDSQALKNNLHTSEKVL